MNNEQTAFIKSEGASPKNKILDFLIIHQEFDYSLKDLAKFAEVGYSTLKIMQNQLLKDKWIIMTRKVGRAKMYKLNLKNKKVQKFIEYYWSVIESEIDEKTTTKKFSTETNQHISVRSF